MAGKDYYEILGVGRDASPEELKKRYYRLSMQLHPDRQNGKSDAEKKEAEEKFKEVNEAYSVLSDPDKRRKYDQFGSADEPAGGFGGDGFDPMEFFRRMHSGFGFGGFGDGFGDDDSSGGFSPFGFHTGCRGGREAPDLHSPEDGDDVQVRVPLTFKESVFGCSKEFTVSLDKECPKCGGSGAKDGSKPSACPTCHGHGSVAHIQRNGLFTMQQVTTCPSCGGSGWSYDKCPECGGAGRVAEERRVRAKVPAGVSPDQRVRIAGAGRCGVRGGRPGDMYLTPAVEPSKLFTRNGDDVEVVVPVGAGTATAGGSVEVPTLKGFRKVKVAPGTKTGTRLRIAGEGVRPAGRKAGDLIVRVVVEPYDEAAARDAAVKALRDAEESGRIRAKGAAAMKEAADEFYA